MKVIEGSDQAQPVHVPFDAAMDGLARGVYTSAEVGDPDPDIDVAAESASGSTMVPDAKATGKKSAT